MDEGRFSLVNFYERRARRILPALYFVMAICVLVAWKWLNPSEMKDFAQSLVAVSTFSSNILFWSESGYFDTVAELKPLLHTWSLAVEEQYYIIFPLLLMATWRLGKKRILIILTIVLLFSFSLGWWGAYNKPTAAFYLLPARGWEILVGAFAAFYLQNKTDEVEVSNTNQAASFLGLLLIFYAIFGFDKQTPFPSPYTLVPTIGVVLVILFAVKGTFANAILSNKILVGIGLISYSAYLWHQPLFVFAKHFSLTGPSEYVMLVLCIVTFPLAFLSWKYVEKPFRSKGYFGRKMIFLFSGLCGTLFILLGINGHINDGWRSRLDIPPNVKWMSLGDRLKVVGDICSPSKKDFGEGVVGCYFGDLKATKVLAMYGDSHAQAISNELDQAFKAEGLKGLKISLDKCELVPSIVNTATPIDQNCKSKLERMSLYLSAHTEGLILVSRWTMRLFPIEEYIEELAFDNKEGGVETILYREYAVLAKDGSIDKSGKAKHNAIMHFFDALPKTIPTVLVYPIPEVGWDIFQKNLRYYDDEGTVLPMISTSQELYKNRNRFVIDVFDQYISNNPNFLAVKPEAIFCSSFVVDKCIAQFSGVPFYYDSDHLSDEGASLVVQNIMRHIL